MVATALISDAQPDVTLLLRSSRWEARWKRARLEVEQEISQGIVISVIPPN